MNIIVVSHRHGQTRTISLGGLGRIFLFIGLCGLPLVVGYWGYQLAVYSDDSLFNEHSAQAWKDELAAQRDELRRTRQHAGEQLDALMSRMAQLQARLLRIDALGERITTIAKLDRGEFDFSAAPALGGPETGELGEAYQLPEFVEVMDQLAQQIEDREQQLEVLETLLGNRKIQNDVFLAGRPINKGWMSSRFGRRTDPINGRLAWHSGVDFAGKDGSDIVAVASGVVTWSASRHGYGRMVEINHGGGFSTRYAHAKENLVKVGDVVKKGQIVALMGSSGRSTGPHVHFEVYKNGRAVDPARYIYRTRRR